MFRKLWYGMLFHRILFNEIFQIKSQKMNLMKHVSEQL